MSVFSGLAADLMADGSKALASFKKAGVTPAGMGLAIGVGVHDLLAGANVETVMLDAAGALLPQYALLIDIALPLLLGAAEIAKPAGWSTPAWADRSDDPYAAHADDAAAAVKAAEVPMSDG